MITTCGIFLFRGDGRFLIGHVTNSNDSVFSIPKGRCEDNEKYIDTAVRELNEETSISIDVSCVVGEASFYSYKYSKKRLKAFLIFINNEDIPEIKCTSTVEPHGFPEFDYFKWITSPEAKGLIHETQVKALQELLENATIPIDTKEYSK